LQTKLGNLLLGEGYFCGLGTIHVTWTPHGDITNLCKYSHNKIEKRVRKDVRRISTTNGGKKEEKETKYVTDKQPYQTRDEALEGFLTKKRI